MADVTTISQIAADIFTANVTTIVNDATTIQTTTSGDESTTTGETDWKTGIYILAGIRNCFQPFSIRYFFLKMTVIEFSW